MTTTITGGLAIILTGMYLTMGAVLALILTKLSLDFGTAVRWTWQEYQWKKEHGDEWPGTWIVFKRCWRAV